MTETRCGYVAIIGAPNAGKSTLLNQIIGQKVTIVSKKVQTTRTRISGIMMYENSQIIFIDTPGIFKPQKRLDRAMVHAAWEGVKDADCIALIVDTTKSNPVRFLEPILKNLEDHSKPVVLVLNKIDSVKKESLLALTAEFTERFPFKRVFMISALKGHGTKEFVEFMSQAVPYGDFLFDPEDITTTPMRLLAAELTREKIFNQLYQEIPYACTVETDVFDESDPQKWLIEQTVYVQRESQRAIILGHKGQQLKKIGMAARLDMQKQFGVPILLSLFIKVRDEWLEDPDRFRAMGLDYKV